MSLKDTLEPEEPGIRDVLHVFVGVMTFIILTYLSDWITGFVAALLAMFVAEACLEVVAIALDRRLP